MALLFPPPPPFCLSTRTLKYAVSPARKRRLKRQEWNIFHDRNVRHAPCFRGSDGNVHHSESWTPAKPPQNSPATRHPLLQSPGGNTEREGGRRGSGHALPTGTCDSVWHRSLISSEVSPCAEVAEAGRKWLRMDEGVRTHYALTDAPESCRQARARLVFPVVRGAAASGHGLPFNQTLSFLLTLPAVSAAWHILKLWLSSAHTLSAFVTWCLCASVRVAAVVAHPFYVCCFAYVTHFCYSVVYGLYDVMPLCCSIMFVNMYHFVGVSWTVVIEFNVVLSLNWIFSFWWGFFFLFRCAQLQIHILFILRFIELCIVYHLLIILQINIFLSL